VTRSLSSPFANALLLGDIRPFPLIDLNFDAGDGGPDYICGLDSDVVYGGHTYRRAAGAIKIDSIEETSDSSQGARLYLAAPLAANISVALGITSQGRLMTIRLALIDGAGALQVDDNVWSGMMDAMSFSDQIDGGSITIPAEHMLSIWDRPRPSRYTDAYQQKLVAGDLGLQYIEEMAEASFVWPGKEFFL